MYLEGITVTETLENTVHWIIEDHDPFVFLRCGSKVSGNSSTENQTIGVKPETNRLYCYDGYNRLYI